MPLTLLWIDGGNLSLHRVNGMKLLANRWGMLPSQGGVAFAGFFSVGACSFRANATPLQTHFGGDDSDPSLIRQQYDGIRPDQIVLTEVAAATIVNKL